MNTKIEADIADVRNVILRLSVETCARFFSFLNPRYLFILLRPLLGLSLNTPHEHLSKKRPLQVTHGSASFFGVCGVSSIVNLFMEEKSENIG